MHHIKRIPKNHQKSQKIPKLCPRYISNRVGMGQERATFVCELFGYELVNVKLRLLPCSSCLNDVLRFSVCLIKHANVPGQFTGRPCGCQFAGVGSSDHVRRLLLLLFLLTQLLCDISSFPCCGIGTFLRIWQEKPIDVMCGQRLAKRKKLLHIVSHLCHDWVPHASSDKVDSWACIR